MLSDEERHAVRGLIDRINRRRALSATEREARQREYFRPLLDRMLRTGETVGEASGAPGTAIKSGDDEATLRTRLRETDNDLLEQVRIVREGVEHYFAHGQYPAPYYAWRIAVILRKRKQDDLELEFLETFSKKFQDGVGARYGELAARARKIRQGRITDSES